MDVARHRQDSEVRGCLEPDISIEAPGLHLTDVAVDRDAEILVERGDDPVLVVDLPPGQLRLDAPGRVAEAKVERVRLLRLHRHDRRVVEVVGARRREALSEAAERADRVGEIVGEADVRQQLPILIVSSERRVDEVVLGRDGTRRDRVTQVHEDRD